MSGLDGAIRSAQALGLDCEDHSAQVLGLEGAIRSAQVLGLEGAIRSAQVPGLDSLDGAIRSAQVTGLDSAIRSAQVGARTCQAGGAASQGACEASQEQRVIVWVEGVPRLAVMGPRGLEIKGTVESVSSTSGRHPFEATPPPPPLHGGIASCLVLHSLR